MKVLSFSAGLTYSSLPEAQDLTVTVLNNSWMGLGMGPVVGSAPFPSPNPAQDVSIPSWACGQTGIPGPHSCQQAF